MSFTLRSRGTPSPSATTVIEPGSTTRRCRWSTCAPATCAITKRIGSRVRHHHDDPLAVVVRDPVHLVDRPRLYLEQALAPGEAHRRGDPLDGSPELGLPDLRDRPPGPLPVPGVDEPAPDVHAQPAGLRERSGGLAAALEGAGVDGLDAHPVESLDESIRPRPCPDRSGARRAASRLGACRPRRCDRAGSAAASPCGVAYPRRVRRSETPQPEAGSRTSNRVPCPNSLVTTTRPPWFSATCLTIDRPSPVPPVSRDRARSTR